MKLHKNHMYNHLNVSKQMTDVTLLLSHCNTWNNLAFCKQMINSKYYIEIFANI